jgi:hypothetical protein
MLLKPAGAGELPLRAKHKVSGMEKIARIELLVAWLREQLGDTFATADHWEADLAAIGICARDDPQQLVYIGVWGLPAGRYNVELESADLNAGIPSRPGLRYDAVTREELLIIVADHLKSRARS